MGASRKYLAVGLAWVAMVIHVSARAEQPDDIAANDYRIIGYVADGPALPKISADKLDVINFAFALVNPSHEVFLPQETAARSLAGLVALREANPDLKVLLSIGGWGAGNFSEAALTEAARARFADTAVELVRKHDLDGLDIDWEYPAHPGPGISHRPEDKQNFTRMLIAIREKLDALSTTNSGRRYLLTIAAADGEAAKGLEIAKIARILDWINLMTYDFYGSLTPTTGHHASLYRSSTAAPDSRNTQKAVDEFIKAGAPPRKINIGLAFYGRTFGDVAVEQHGLHQRFGSDGGFISWQEIARDHLGKPGVVRYWDEQAQSAWLWNEEQRRLISYDDPQALQAKARFVRQRGLGGVMYWEQRQDPDEQLLDVVRAALYPAP
ncbi:glycoside hydrolase family 18 protein [Pseudoxanthomonas sp. UTMC 1351]|uniref:glycoside hydrolase family 18 protein n=1 Tax=Pseudoxanthomonas sp. UTMC 1351 TaxID=2695853 RepID=UPI0034CDE21D